MKCVGFIVAEKPRIEIDVNDLIDMLPRPPRPSSVRLDLGEHQVGLQFEMRTGVVYGDVSHIPAGRYSAHIVGTDYRLGVTLREPPTDSGMRRRIHALYDGELRKANAEIDRLRAEARDREGDPSKAYVTEVTMNMDHGYGVADTLDGGREYLRTQSQTTVDVGFTCPLGIPRGEDLAAALAKHFERYESPQPTRVVAGRNARLQISVDEGETWERVGRLTDNTEENYTRAKRHFDAGFRAARGAPYSPDPLVTDFAVRAMRDMHVAVGDDLRRVEVGDEVCGICGQTNAHAEMCPRWTSPLETVVGPKAHKWGKSLATQMLPAYLQIEHYKRKIYEGLAVPHELLDPSPVDRVVHHSVGRGVVRVLCGRESRDDWRTHIVSDVNCAACLAAMSDKPVAEVARELAERRIDDAVRQGSVSAPPNNPGDVEKALRKLGVEDPEVTRKVAKIAEELAAAYPHKQHQGPPPKRRRESKCECGGATTAGTHSDWCPEHES